MKYFIILLITPFFLFCDCENPEYLRLSIKSIYNHAKSEKLKYEGLLKARNTHDMGMIYQGHKLAYEDMLRFISSFDDSTDF